MTFDAFCPVGGSRDAYDACLDFARRPDTATRFLVVDGPVGCGKTHLLHAIANDVRTRRQNAEVLCLRQRRSSTSWRPRSCLTARRRSSIA